MRRIFIVGCARSGTTLLQEILAVRADVYTCAETHYFQKIRRRGKGKILDYLYLSPGNVRRAYDFVRAHSELVETHDPHYVRTLADAARFFDQIMTSQARAIGKPVWVEKTPAHLFHIRLIQRYLPSAQFVHVLRDGRDVVASLVDAARRFPQAAAWRAYADLENATEAYNRCIGESLKYYGAEGHIFVQYERIVDDVEDLRRKLYAALNLEDQRSSLDLVAVHDRVVRRDEEWKADTGGEVRDTRLLKFKQMFDDEQRRRITSRLLRFPPKLMEILL